jgi:hypothetical protein
MKGIVLFRMPLAALVVYLAVGCCVRPQAPTAPIAAHWRSADAAQRQQIINECVANDFQFLIGRNRDEVISLMGRPDRDAFRSRTSMVLTDSIGYSFGSTAQSSYTLGPEPHQVLGIEFDKENKASSVYVTTIW